MGLAVVEILLADFPERFSCFDAVVHRLEDRREKIGSFDSFRVFLNLFGLFLVDPGLKLLSDLFGILLSFRLNPAGQFLLLSCLIQLLQLFLLADLE